MNESNETPLISLSPVERLILANQYKILLEIAQVQKHVPGSPSSHTFAEAMDEQTLNRYIEILERGYEKEYKEIIESIYENQHLKTSDCQEVVGILKMYHCLHDSFDQLDEKDKIEIREAADKENFHEAKIQIRFPGFDGNNEEQRLAYAKFLLSSGYGELTRFKYTFPNTTYIS